MHASLLEGGRALRRPYACALRRSTPAPALHEDREASHPTAAQGVPTAGVAPTHARPVAEGFGNAISVQFQANSAETVELWHRNMCIPCARARGPAEYADDAK